MPIKAGNDIYTMTGLLIVEANKHSRSESKEIMTKLLNIVQLVMMAVVIMCGLVAISPDETIETRIYMAVMTLLAWRTFDYFYGKLKEVTRNDKKRNKNQGV